MAVQVLQPQQGRNAEQMLFEGGRGGESPSLQAPGFAGSILHALSGGGIAAVVRLSLPQLVFGQGGVRQSVLKALDTAISVGVLSIKPDY